LHDVSKHLPCVDFAQSGSGWTVICDFRTMGTCGEDGSFVTLTAVMNGMPHRLFSLLSVRRATLAEIDIPAKNFRKRAAYGTPCRQKNRRPSSAGARRSAAAWRISWRPDAVRSWLPEALKAATINRKMRVTAARM
jgi:hypothetical protein